MNEVRVGSRIFNIDKITDIISSSFLYKGGGGVRVIRGNWVQGHGEFCKVVQVCVCCSDFEGVPTPSR